MTGSPREPRAFILEPDDTATARPAKTARRAARPHVEFAAEPENQALVEVPATVARAAPRRFRWLALLVSALFTLVSLWAGLAITQLVESFFARNAVLGWFALGVAAVAGLSALAIILREAIALFRLRRIEGLQEETARAINLNEKAAAQSAVSQLRTLYAGRHDTAWSVAELDRHTTDILDPRDRVRLAERLLVSPLDDIAHRMIARRARRVTLLTTVTPAAALDMLFVGAQNLALLRELAALYGGKPSTLSTLRLARMVVTHLAVSGGLALSDNFIHLFVGKGLLGKLSARFGEGAVNGILTARIGLAACEVCRPVPMERATRETLARVLKEVVTFNRATAGPAAD